MMANENGYRPTGVGFAIDEIYPALTPIAQWKERLTTNQEVARSNRARGTYVVGRLWQAERLRAKRE